MNNVLEQADWTFPIPIKFGPGRLAELATICNQASMHRPLIVTDRGTHQLPFVSQTLSRLRDANLDAQLFSDVSPNPTDREISDGAALFLAGDHDGVIALGGGSGMDAGKGISLIARNGHDLWEFDYDRHAPNLNSSHFVPLICIPTTAGTGAETESTAMVTDVARGVKGCVWHPSHRPMAAILDPELTLGLPQDLTAWTGCDALIHAIEALSVPSWHPLCDATALQAIRLIYRWLPEAVSDGTNLAARGGMLVGSCLAGISFLKGLGLVHAMSHMIGAVFNTHHGLTNAVLLPLVLRYNREGLGENTALMCQAMGLAGDDFDTFYAAIVDMLDALEIPRGLDALGVDAKRLGELAEKAHTDAACATNPVPANVEQIKAILVQALHAAR